MAKRRLIETTAARVFDNIIFIADVFADREDGEIPDVPLLDLARSFELSGSAQERRQRQEANRYRIIQTGRRLIAGVSGKAPPMDTSTGH
ncbi:MAG TPA: hypothetical protein VGH16_12485 [Candidatus Binatia bacterium]|jgi:hypothetical protein